MKQVSIVTCEAMPTLDYTPAWYSKPVTDRVNELKEAGMTEVEITSITPVPFTYMATIRYEDNQ